MTSHRVLPRAFALFRSTAVLALLALAPLVAKAQTPEPPGSPDGVWTVLEEVELPPRFPAPRAFVALRQNSAALDEILDKAPRENFDTIPADASLWLPLAGGGFTAATAARSQLMEAPLAARFPEISTYVFRGDGFAGHLARGPQGDYFAIQIGDQLWHIEPVETAAGRIYLSYLDAARMASTS